VTGLGYDEELIALRLLADRRDELSRRRVQTVNRLQRLLTELVPGGAKRDLSAQQAKRLLATVKPRSLVGKTIRAMAAEEIADLVAVDTKLTAMKVELRAAVRARGSQLMDLFGLGPATAARILSDVGDLARFPDRNHVASWTGTPPLDASSGDQIRHRGLPGRQPPPQPRPAHRRHRADPPRHRGPPRLPAQAGRVQDTDGGAALPEAKDLRRGLPPAPHRRPDRHQHGPGRALGGVVTVQRGRPVHPGHRLFGSATSRTRTTDATRHTTPCEDPRGPGSQQPAATSAGAYSKATGPRP
jgi:hypothetical protein